MHYFTVAHYVLVGVMPAMLPTPPRTRRSHSPGKRLPDKLVRAARRGHALRVLLGLLALAALAAFLLLSSGDAQARRSLEGEEGEAHEGEGEEGGEEEPEEWCVPHGFGRSLRRA